jgi:hypothetical protein
LTALYLIRKVAPEGSNAIRDLSQHLENPQGDHWKSIMRLAGYLKKNKPKLRIRRPRRWRIIAYTDSNYATDTHDRKSISGSIVTIDGSLVSWASKKQDIVALSSREAEYIASTVCSQEIIFAQQLMEEIDTIDDIATLYGDNNGAIFISRHSHVGPRTKHIDVRYHYIRELIADGKLSYLKIKGEQNPADIMTKNVTEKILEIHKKNMNNGTLVGCTTTESWSREDVENAHYVVLCRNVWTVENTTNGRIHNGVTKHVCDLAEEPNVQDIQIEDERSNQVESEDSKNKVKHEEDSIIEVEDRMTGAEKQMAKNEPSGKDERLQKDWDD